MQNNVDKIVDLIKKNVMILVGALVAVTILNATVFHLKGLTTIYAGMFVLFGAYIFYLYRKDRKQYKPTNTNVVEAEIVKK